MKNKKILICMISVILLSEVITTGCTFNTSGSVREKVPAEGDTINEEETEFDDVIEELSTIRDFICAAMAENGTFTKEDINSAKRNFRVWGNNCAGMTKEQIKKYVELLGQACSAFGMRFDAAGSGYPRVLDEAIGILPVDAPRLTVDALDKIVRDSRSFIELYDNIEGQYGSPDYSSLFSGPVGGVCEYWLDDKGTERINLTWKAICEDDDYGFICIGRNNYDDSKGDFHCETLYSYETLEEIYWQKAKETFERAMAEDEHYAKEDILIEKESPSYNDRIKDCFGMREEKIKEYARRLGLVKRRSGDSSTYLRICDELNGRMSADTPRLTVEALEKLISQSSSAVVLYDYIHNQYDSPDFLYSIFGAVGRQEQYWLDDEGAEWIELTVGFSKGGDWGVKCIKLKNYEDYLGDGETLYIDDYLEKFDGTAE